MNLKKKKMKTIAKILFAICYFGCCLVLIVEAALPGSVSSNQSNTIGGGIADIINNGAGDQSVLIKPTGIKIKKPDSTSLSVGDTLSLETTIEPENCSFQSVSFQSADDSVLSIDEKGKVTAKKEGKAVVTVHSASYPDIKDTITFSVFDIKETAISSTVKNLTENEDGYYLLQANHSYPIETVFTPSNTTDQSLSYSLSSERLTEEEIPDYVTISNDTIYAKKKTAEDTSIDVIVSSKNGLTSSLSLKIEENKEEVIPLESISLESKTAEAYFLAVKETIEFTSKYKISYYPSSATYKNYRLESSDPSIIKVTGNKITGVSIGECDIRVYSTIYDVSSSIRVSVKERVLERVSISLNYLSEPKIRKGNTSYIRYSSAYPNNSDSILQKLYDFKSSDESILTIDSTGKVTAKEEGTATVTMNFYRSKEEMEKGDALLSCSIDVTVFVPSKINAIDYTNTLDETDDNSHILYNGKSYNLSSYIKIANLYDLDGNKVDAKKEGISTSLTYTIVDKSGTTSDLSSVNITDGILSTKGNDSCGSITIEYSHPESGLSESISYTLLNEMNPIIENEDDIDSFSSASSKAEFDGKEYDVLSTELNLYVASNATVRFEDNADYAFRLSDNASRYLNITSLSSSSLSLRGVDEGSLFLLITPIYDGTEILSASKIMKIAVHHKVATSFSLQLFEKDSEINLSEKTEENGDVSLSVYIDSSIHMEAVFFPFASPTNYRLSVRSDHNDIGTYKDSLFRFDKVGKVSFVIQEEVSQYSRKVTFYVINRVKLKENPISIEQSKASYDKESNTYHIENGTSAKIITNFEESSTFQSVKYTSSDEEILKVGDDGVITPFKAGSCDITCLINDNNSIDYQISVHITVDKKNLISNMTSFLYMIRKGLGHFGAFLITAVFSVLFYLFLFEDKRNWFFSIPFIYLQGLFVAELTEFIQLFTPNRSGLWSDVMIDFTGFSIGASLTLLIIFLYYLIQYFLKRKKEKNKE